VAVDALLAVLERVAQAEAESRREAARQRASSILRSAEGEAERRMVRAEERLAAEERSAVRRETAGVVRAQREQLLSARNAVLERVFASASARLEQLPVARYSGRVAALADEALGYLEHRPVVVTARPEVAGILRLHLQGRLDVTVEASVQTPPGLTARSADGEVTVDNALPARLAHRREELAIALVRRLEEP
jgi:vacuolar-type H+-ATPase subunit E/Vma4